MSEISKYTPATIIRQIDARNFMEGSEHCREYIKTEKLWFGTSTLPPGACGSIDPGHANSQEVFFVCKGHVLLFDEKQHYELFAGDVIFIPETLPHTLINVGDETAIIAWAGAPGG
jgi:oxalate decarboxylase/phosphoglucose isomerase-like protein (cupin superfamily)